LWFLTDRSTRAISPLSKITLPHYIEACIKEASDESLDEAETLASGNPDLKQSIAAAREALALRAAIRQANDLAGSGKLADAILVLDKLAASASTNSPSYSQAFRARGILQARSGKQEAARTDFAQAIACSAEDNWNWYQLGLLFSQSFDINGYRNHCERMIARSRGNSDPAVLERVAKVCLLVPTGGVDSAEPARLATKAAELGEKQQWAVYFQLVKALAEYRLGNFSAAADWAKKVIAKQGMFSLDVQAGSILAMAQYRLNNAEEARSSLATATLAAEKSLPKPDASDLGSSWHDVLIARQLLKEAQALVVQQAGGSSKLPP
ncbi:MAG: hypothetical protein WCO84_07670, partial [bacterium]